MTDLQSLIERVETLTGPDRELAADICEVVGFKVRRHCVTRFGRRAAAWSYFAPTDRRWHSVEPILSSADAALAFAERVLPGWVLGSIVRAYSAGDDPSPYYCVLAAPGSGGVPGDWSGRIEATADTIPLAIILAALRAKKKEAQNG